MLTSVMAMIVGCYGAVSFAAQLNSEQQKWLAENGPVRYCTDPHWKPMDAIVQGKHVGMAADYIDLLEGQFGLQFELVVTQSWSESLLAVQQGRCDILPMLNESPQRDTFLLFTRPYLNMPVVLVSDQKSLQTLSDLSNRTLAITRNYRYQELISEHHPDIVQILVESEAQALQLVAQHQADAMIGSLAPVVYMIQERGWSHLRITTNRDMQDSLRIGVTQRKPELVGILQQALDQVSAAEHDRVYQRWNPSTYGAQWEITDFWMWLVGAFVFLLFLAYRFYVLAMQGVVLDSKNYELDIKNRQLEQVHTALKERNKELEFLSTHDSLTKLVNRRYFEQRAVEELNRSERQQAPLSLLLLDLDNFKTVNDTYGHGAGDNVLVHIASLLRDQLRSTDIIGRWGGEEFIILCPDTSLQVAADLAERLRKIVNLKPIEPVGKVSCSIGVVEFNQGEAFDTGFSRADELLYQAKNKRNQVVSGLHKPLSAVL